MPPSPFTIKCVIKLPLNYAWAHIFVKNARPHWVKAPHIMKIICAPLFYYNHFVFRMPFYFSLQDHRNELSRLLGAHNTLQKLEFLFKLPHTVDECIVKGDMNQVSIAIKCLWFRQSIVLKTWVGRSRLDGMDLRMSCKLYTRYAVFWKTIKGDISPVYHHCRDKEGQQLGGCIRD